MKNATDNAEEMHERLTRSCNRASPGQGTQKNTEHVGDEARRGGARVAPPTGDIMANATAEKTGVGRVVQVIGPVLDVEFDPEHLPEIYNALRLKTKTASGQDINLIAEVQQHIGRGQVRAVSMSSTDGVTRGMDVVDTGSAITVPVGEAALGRILNVLGEPVDEMGPVGGGG